MKIEKKLKNISALYVHIPFCVRKCFYCAFPIVVAQGHHARRYVHGLLREAEALRGAALRTVYWGGGTPALLPLGQQEELAAGMKEIFDCSGVEEWTIETNPETVGQDSAGAWRTWGLTRVSLGVQSLCDEHLRILGRSHNREQAVAAVARLKRAGLKDINVDMMFALPGQTRQQAEHDFREAAGLRTDHVSAYALTIEENSRYAVAGVCPADKQTDRGMYLQMCSLLQECGFRQYEVSNFARPGHESRHNLNYWQGGNYIGIGMGAHSHHDGIRWWNTSNFKDYLKRVEAGESPRAGEESLTPERRLREALVFGLRLNEGVSLRQLQERYGQGIPGEVHEKILEFISQGWLEESEHYLRATDSGRCLLDSLAVELI